MKLRLRGTHVAIADNVAVTEGSYAKFLDSLGISRNAYQHIQTSMGSMDTWVQDFATDRLASKVFVVGQVGVLPSAFERVYALSEAQWILCGRVGRHDLQCLQLERLPPSPNVLLWPHQDIDITDFHRYDLHDNVRDIETKNPQIEWMRFGCPEVSFLEDLKVHTGIISHKDVLFVSGEHFHCWDFINNHGIASLCVGAEKDFHHSKAQYHMTHLRW